MLLKTSMEKIPLKNQLLYSSLLLGILLVTYAIYQQGLSGVFLFDDFDNLSKINALGGVVDWYSFKQFVLGNESGALGRPLSMLSFLIDDQYFPGSVAKFRYTNVLIHCLTSIAVFTLVYRFLMVLGKSCDKAVQIALITTLWWSLAPINVSTTLYVVQRMAQLSTLFTVVGLIVFLSGRERLAARNSTGWLYVVVGLYGFGFLAVMSKENGILIFLFAALIEWTINLTRAKKVDYRLNILMLVPTGALAGYFIYTWPSVLAGYQFRDFTLIERLLTESRILFDYMLKTLLPLSAKMGLIQDDYVISRSLFDPLSTIVSLFCHGFLLTVAWRCRHRWPLFFFALGFFYAAHILESSFIALELYFEHRNYLPSIVLIMAVVTFAWESTYYKSLLRGVLMFMVAMSIMQTSQRAAIWGDPIWQIALWASEHPNSIRAQTMHGRQLIALEDFNKAENHFLEMKRKWPLELHIDLLLFNKYCSGDFKRRVDLDSLEYSNHTFDVSFDSILEDTMTLFREEKCLSANSESVHSLLQNLAALPSTHPVIKARFFRLDAEVFSRNGNLDGAMRSLDSAFLSHPNSFFRFTQSQLLFSAGVFDEALLFVQGAIDMEESKLPHKRKDLKFYYELKSNIVDQVRIAK